MFPSPPRAQTSDDVAELLDGLYGTRDLRAATGTLHVVSTWIEPGDPPTPRVIKIGPDAPKSATDFFALNLARARADAIITSGKILREEPTLRYDLQGDAAEGLHAWRRDDLGKREPPQVIVLTSGRGLEFSHPTFDSWATPVVFTSQDAAPALDGRAPERTTVVGDRAPSIRNAIAWATERGASTVSIEAGPSTAAALYEEPFAIDELLLSTFTERMLEPSVRGGRFVARATIEQQLGQIGRVTEVQEPSGRWRFERWRRRSSSA